MADNDAAGSSAGLDAGDHATTDAKIDVARDGTPSSMESTPEADGGNEVQEPAAQPQKRKGGRKPVSCQVTFLGGRLDFEQVWGRWQQPVRSNNGPVRDVVQSL